MKRFIALAFVVSTITTVPTIARGKDLNLVPSYQPRPQTDSERLQNFRAPAPPPTSYPNISGGDRGDPRLNVNRDLSLGGSINAHGAEGNVRFPIPGRR